MPGCPSAIKGMEVPQETSGRAQRRRTVKKEDWGVASPLFSAEEVSFSCGEEEEVGRGCCCCSSYMAAPKPTQPKTAGQTLAMKVGWSACFIRSEK